MLKMAEDDLLEAPKAVLLHESLTPAISKTNIPVGCESVCNLDEFCCCVQCFSFNTESYESCQ